ncbi:hydroxymethylglutaryl-CoA lyase [Pseudochryseolinea flava]|uniref:Hydroxymethylglutaryl-CoA lyase n=1 Tax=Pseudochryseolinea flava TaxID=2059302 RepID=A0A364XX43_9BACT|nr:hydroxymethylglutaryl-CoA lyase [Pseudochryseolinea flava]RAV97979.1 hydroxymethylglutaryl-CoA lyase [Pseudochryseolinea flava]
MKLVECPRDAMQGLTDFIKTEDKVRYINQLLKVGFDTIDFGSFVSPKAIPQMRDTAEVLAKLEWEQSSSKLLAIVANTRGAAEAAELEGIKYLGFPLSISETFQQRNTNKSIAEALSSLEEIQNICVAKNKKLVSYISMGFGNPYNDPYAPELVVQFADILKTLGSDVISLADTVGSAEPQTINDLYASLSRHARGVEFGIHLHSTPQAAQSKIAAAYQAGCRRFDGALRGFGGCPMAKDDLVGNLATETIVMYLGSQEVPLTIDSHAFAEAMKIADEIFPKH